MRRVGVIAVLAIALTACGGASQEALSPSVPTDAVAATLPPGTASTVNKRQEIDAVLKVSAETTIGGLVKGTVAFAFTYESKSTHVLTAWQLQIDSTITDRLGRTFSFRGLKDCTDAGLAAGERRQGFVYEARYSRVADAEERLAALEQSGRSQDGCADGSFTPEQSGFLTALEDGAIPITIVMVNRIVMDDGTALGSAL